MDDLLLDSLSPLEAVSYIKNNVLHNTIYQSSQDKIFIETSIIRYLEKYKSIDNLSIIDSNNILLLCVEGYYCKPIEYLFQTYPNILRNDTRYGRYGESLLTKFMGYPKNDQYHTYFTELISIFFKYGYNDMITDSINYIFTTYGRFYRNNRSPPIVIDIDDLLNGVDVNLFDYNRVHPTTRMMLLSSLILSFDDDNKLINVLEKILQSNCIDINKFDNTDYLLMDKPFYAHADNFFDIAKDICHYTPLFLSVFTLRIGVVDLLLKYGANPYIECGEKSHICLTALNYVNNYNHSISHHINDRVKECIKLFKKYNIDINWKNKYGETALMAAAHTHNRYFMSLLIKHGAKVTILNNKRQSAIDYALPKNGFSLCVNLLLRNGIDHFPSNDTLILCQYALSKNSSYIDSDLMAIEKIKIFSAIYNLLPLPIAESITYEYEI